MKRSLIGIFLMVSALQTSFAQSVDSLNRALFTDSIRQVDLVDYLNKIFKINNFDQKRVERKVRFSLFPSTSGISGDKTVFTSFNAAFSVPILAIATFVWFCLFS